MRFRFALGVAALVIASGCLGPATTLSKAADVALAVGPSLHLGGQSAPVGEMVTWQGRHLQENPTTSLPLASTGPCSPSNCEFIRFRIDNTSSSDDDLILRLGATWPFSTRKGDFDAMHPEFATRLTTPQGKTLAGASSTYGSLVRVPNPAPGIYQITVRITGGTPFAHGYQGFARLDRDPIPDEASSERRPDLALMFIGDLQLAKSLPGDFNPTTAPAPMTKGCGLDEFQEHRHLRCLRFSASIANAGDGPLMLFFEEGDGTVKVKQCVERADGTTTLRDAGAGAWHEAHWHHHHHDVVDYRLYKYDLATGARGEPASKGQKFGWGFAAQGVLPHLLPQTYSGGRVFSPPQAECPNAPTGGSYGLPRGWHDPYLFWRNGNYVDVTNVPDGTYELEIVLDAKDAVLETDLHDNKGSIVLRLRGDDVEQLTTFQRDFAPAAP